MRFENAGPWPGVFVVRSLECGNPTPDSPEVRTDSQDPKRPT